MILKPCSGGVVAIGPPVVEGRIVAAAAQGARGPDLAILVDGGDGGPRRRPDRRSPPPRPDYGSLGLANHGPMAAEALAHLGRRRRHRGLGGRLPAPPRPGARRGGAAPHRGGLARGARAGRPLSRVARPLRAGDGRPAPRPPSWASGPRAWCPAAVGAATHGLIRTGHAVRALAGGRHAAAAPRGRHRARVLGLELSGAARAAAPDRARGRRPTRWPTFPISPRTRRARCSSATGSPPWPTSPTSSNRRWPRSAGPAGAVDLLDQLASGGAARLPAQRGRRGRHRPAPFGHVAAGLRAPAARGWPRRTAPPRWATSGRPSAALHVAYDVDRSSPVPAERRPRPPRTWSTGPWPRATSTPSS